MTATRVLVVGEPLAELLEGPSGPTERFGGDALNLSVYLKRESPGLHVGLAGAVGDDRDSEALRLLCRDEGIDDSQLRRVIGATLGRYHVAVDPAGERSFTYERTRSPFRGALDDDGVLPAPEGVDVLCFSGICAAVLHRAGRERLFAFANAVRERGGIVMYDPNHRPMLWDEQADARRWTERVAPIVDMFMASVDDGRHLTIAETSRSIAEGFHTMGAREVVVTDGSRPCVVAVDGGVESVVPPVLERIVDTTAAGDAFDAGYLAARLRGRTPVASAATGHAVASAVVGHPGAISPRLRT